MMRQNVHVSVLDWILQTLRPPFTLDSFPIALGFSIRAHAELNPSRYESAPRDGMSTPFRFIVNHILKKKPTIKYV